MGVKMSKALNEVSAEESKILIVGLKGAGKTSMLYELGLGDIETIVQRNDCGFDVQTVQHDRMDVTVWGHGAQAEDLSLWKQYVRNTVGVIFVVDSSNREVLPEARNALRSVLADEDLQHAPIMVFANKQDLPSAMGKTEVTQELGLLEVDRQWSVQASCANFGVGIFEGLDWLSHMILEQRSLGEEQKELRNVQMSVQSAEVKSAPLDSPRSIFDGRCFSDGAMYSEPARNVNVHV